MKPSLQKRAEKQAEKQNMAKHINSQRDIATSNLLNDNLDETMTPLHKPSSVAYINTSDLSSPSIIKVIQYSPSIPFSPSTAVVSLSAIGSDDTSSPRQLLPPPPLNNLLVPPFPRSSLINPFFILMRTNNNTRYIDTLDTQSQS